MLEKAYEVILDGGGWSSEEHLTILDYGRAGLP
jgi:hypothetical protein